MGSSMFSVILGAWGRIHKILPKMCLKIQRNRKITILLSYVLSLLQANQIYSKSGI